MTEMARLIGDRGVHVARFEFAYMAARRTDAKKRPPSRLPILIEEYRHVLSQLASQTASPKLFIGGKSMGGRVASLLASEPDLSGSISGLVCLGYPFHPPGKPDNLRTGHLADLQCPSLVVQGERDPFGNVDEIPGYPLPASMTVHWAASGNHDLVPPKKSGLTAQQNWTDAADAVADFVLAKAN